MASSYNSKLFQEGFDVEEFAADLKHLLSFEETDIAVLIQQLNSVSVKEIRGLPKALEKVLARPRKEIPSALDAVSYILQWFSDESEEELDRFFKDLQVSNVATEEQCRKIRALLKDLDPYGRTLTERHRYEVYRDAYDYRFERMGTNCKLKVQFDKDFSASQDVAAYDAESDLKDVIPVADIYIHAKHKKDEKDFIFQVDASQLANMISVLRLTRKQLEAVEKLVTIKREIKDGDKT
jgi:hypothetical protein